MKQLFVVLLALGSFSALASNARVASSTEKLKLCEAVDRALQEDGVNAAVNTNRCTLASIRVKGDIITGNVPLLAPARAYDVKCTAIMKYGIVSMKSLKCELY